MLVIKQKRLERGWTQTDLAFKAKKLSPSDISRFESGRTKPYPGQAARIAKALGIAPEHLLEPATTT